MSHRTRAGQFLALLATAVLATACDKTPLSPSPGSPNLPSLLSIRVIGQTNYNVGDQGQLQAFAVFSDGTEQNITNIASWACSTAIASIGSNSGLLQALALGSCNVTATFNSVTGQLTIIIGGSGDPGPGAGPGAGPGGDPGPGAGPGGDPGPGAGPGGDPGPGAGPGPGPGGTLEICGLRVVVDGNIIGSGGGLIGGLSLDLLDLLNDPILDVRVFALFGDGTTCGVAEEEVTTATAIDVDGDPLVWSDVSGTLNLVSLLVASLTDPSHTLNANYMGFTVEVELDIANNLLDDLGALPIVGTLPLDPGGTLTHLELGTTLPAVVLLLNNGTMPVNLELLVPPAGVDWDFVLDPIDLDCGALFGLNLLLLPVCELLDPVLDLVGATVGDVITVADGVVTGIDLGDIPLISGLPVLGSLLDQVLGTILEAGILTVDVTPVLSGVPGGVLPTLPDIPLDLP